MKFNNVLTEGFFKSNQEKEVLAIEKKYKKSLDALKKIEDPYYHSLNRKKKDEIEAINLKYTDEKDWNDKEVDQWLSLDDRNLKLKIDSGDIISSADPLEIRAKSLYRDLEFSCYVSGLSISFLQQKNRMIKEYGKEAWNLSVKMYDIPDSEEEYIDFCEQYEERYEKRHK